VDSLIKIQAMRPGYIKQKLMNLIHTGKYILIIVICFLLSYCDSTSGNTDKNLNNSTYEVVLERLGKPIRDTVFILTKNLYEYQYSLLTYYPEPEGKHIFIREVIWKSKNDKTVVWFQKINEQWKSFDNLIWNPKKVTY